MTDPRFYAEMSRLLQDLIKQSRDDAAAYEQFLRKAEELARKLAAKGGNDGIPAILHGQREAAVIFRNLPVARGQMRGRPSRVGPPHRRDDAHPCPGRLARG